MSVKTSIVALLVLISVLQFIGGIMVTYEPICDYNVTPFSVNKLRQLCLSHKVVFTVKMFETKDLGGIVFFFFSLEVPAWH